MNKALTKQERTAIAMAKYKRKCKRLATHSKSIASKYIDSIAHTELPNVVKGEYKMRLKYN